MLLQAQAGLQRGRQQPIPQRVTPVTWLVSFLDLQTRGEIYRERERERERKATKTHVKEHRTFAHPGSLIDGCREKGG